MRIAINCRSFLKKNYTGIGRYAYNLVKSLSEIDQENQYFLYLKKSFFDKKRKVPHFEAKNFSVKADFFERGLDKTLGAVDIYHLPSPDSFKTDYAKVIVTVHDLVYKVYPQGHTQETILTTQKLMEHIVKNAAKIICCSKNTIADLQKYFQVNNEKIALVYQGVDNKNFYPLTGDEKKTAKEFILSKGLNVPYILFVGTIEPRKNLENVIRAFALLKEKGQFKGKLLVLGMRGWRSDQVYTLIQEYLLQDEIIFLGFVSNRELCYFYNFAEVFVFPSFYEGFGFPIVEAFSCGCAVVTSNVSSCPEIAQDGALTVDPKSPQVIAESIRRLLEDKSFKEEMQKKALKRAEDYTFLKTAQQTLEVYKEVYQIP